MSPGRPYPDVVAVISSLLPRCARLLAALVACACLLAPAASAQYFGYGKNRVQYEAHDWYTL
ncbi:MAG: hypothetical protein AAGK21_16080, partial [Bacteroidota bacterium]